jgi:isopentenyldiphosphate isomerase/intracellular septation protein A
MNRAVLLKKLLPGFLPLFIFIAADEIWGTRIGLIVAVSAGFIELVWIGAREKRFDRFILYDVVLLIVLGGVSILLDNDIFFKLKPGFVELILVVILGVSVFSPFNIVGLMGQRFLKEVAFSEKQVAQIRKILMPLFYIFLAHTVLVFYSAFYMSNKAWVFISGGLFYIIFAVYFLIEFIRQKRNQKNTIAEEWVPLVDEFGNVTGKAPRTFVHSGSKILHPVVHMHIVNHDKAILLQKRPATKLIQPNRWDTAVGGHISAGETLEQALKKEAYEELGLQQFSAKMVKIYKWESEIEAELVYVFVSTDAIDFNVHTDEVDEIRFWSKKQIVKELGQGSFTPNFEYEFEMLKMLQII